MAGGGYKKGRCWAYIREMKENPPEPALPSSGATKKEKRTKRIPNTRKKEETKKEGERQKRGDLVFPHPGGNRKEKKKAVVTYGEGAREGKRGVVQGERNPEMMKTQAVKLWLTEQSGEDRVLLQCHTVTLEGQKLEKRGGGASTIQPPNLAVGNGREPQLRLKGKGFLRTGGKGKNEGRKGRINLIPTSGREGKGRQGGGGAFRKGVEIGFLGPSSSKEEERKWRG